MPPAALAGAWAGAAAAAARAPSCLPAPHAQPLAEAGAACTLNQTAHPPERNDSDPLLWPAPLTPFSWHTYFIFPVLLASPPARPPALPFSQCLFEAWRLCPPARQASLFDLGAVACCMPRMWRPGCTLPSFSPSPPLSPAALYKCCCPRSFSRQPVSQFYCLFAAPLALLPSAPVASSVVAL